MERIFIDREHCIAYVVLALDSIYHSANKERTINDFIQEIRTMFIVHKDEDQLMKIMKRIVNEKQKLIISVGKKQ